ncbi:MAG: hypothetical protein DMG86_16375 [Acidobacteria bacterium]|nr:MAG: hypothetical protein DMG86_16375 [Acidobacteriota bacterium]PYX12642.1 MAG: hypothetical protein DMG85_01830 [Acidobacteriota bacterium]PYX13930.1 MAG: hypothetical protein DMG84_17275 [Acidobacteriota bacterium]
MCCGGSFVGRELCQHRYQWPDRGKDKLLSNLKGGKWEHNAIGHVKVTLYGDTAIATGSWTGKGVDGDGTKIDRYERWTDTWVKMPNGNWQCVASQQTEVKK